LLKRGPNQYISFGGAIYQFVSLSTGMDARGCTIVAVNSDHA